MQPAFRGLNILQKISMSLMGVLVLITFIGANLQAIFWQSSEWLVSTVLPAVVVQLTNEERAQNSAGPLQRNATLDAAAQLKAEDMAKNGYFAHFSPTGVSPWHWFDEAGYVYAHAGENLAIHFTDSAEVVEAWMDSPTHRQNIVNGIYTEIGVGTAKGKYEGYNTVYVVQLFGTPAIPPAPVEVVPTPEPTPEPTVVAATETPSELPTAAVESETVSASQAEESATVIEIAEKTVPEEVVEIPVPEEEETPIVALEQTPEEVLVLEDPGASQLEIEKPAYEEGPKTVTMADDVVVIESPIISTSSGLAIANITTPNTGHAGGTMASIATQPNELLQIVYMVLGTIVLMLLSVSVVVEARRLHYQQVTYGVLLLLAMGGLWFVNALLTTGAVIV